MPLQQAPAPEDLSAMRLLTVPDVWPPPDAAPEYQRPPGAALDEPAEPTGWSGRPADGGQPWPRQFAVLLAEALTGVRPVRQVQPWLSQRGSVHLHRLLPLFASGQGARVRRVMTTQPSPDVIEMTLIVAIGPRTRALAVRLVLGGPGQPPGWRQKLPARADSACAASAPNRWLCTDIEAA
jgi:hypothetical protein